ncbi:unnamed protein product [Bursaphelenchus xylophilus]|uniref:(pine wood nematode) hypothetical protein n=1 Tax=Bursaphelenchus xylophilus TaxID=6326 RepID=A0A1I7RMH6_BURXY|nr:unnamed protein product [Bursaphelenchus xylophilus]CAG9118502.1 unnamed protein product [Bursaphelenchus xylophilus]
MVVTPTHRSASTSNILPPIFNKRLCKTEQRSDRFGAGRCPHCRLQFVNPVSLHCGHSLCALCCEELLQRDHRYLSQKSPTPEPHTPKRSLSSKLQRTPKFTSSHIRQARTPVMGVRTMQLLSEFMELDKCEVNGSPLRIPMKDEAALRAPGCPVCGAAPSSIAPIKNHALAQVLRALNRRNKAKPSNCMESVPEETARPTSPAPSSASSGFYESDSEIGIKKCNVAVLGAPGVGKTQLARTQYLNNLFFGRSDREQVIKPITDFAQIRARYMLSILDDSNEDADIRKALISAQGFVLLYSTVDPASLMRAQDLADQIASLRGDKPAIIFAATKSDLQSDVQVNSEDGEAIAKNYDAPFFKVSAKENDNVNELFTELVRLVDRRAHQGASSDGSISS